MDIKIDLEDFEVISSGTVIGVIDKPITFHITDLIFELRFRINKDHTEQKILSEIPPNQKRLVITFENFNNSLGIGNVDPLNVGTVNDRLLYLNYIIYSLADNAGKLLHYTWLLENKKGGNDGK